MKKGYNNNNGLKACKAMYKNLVDTFEHLDILTKLMQLALMLQFLYLSAN